MDSSKVLLIILIVSMIMYLMRMVPLVFCKGKFKNKFLQSFLSYVPYAVLTSITIPEVFNSTSSSISAVCGVVAAVVLAYVGEGLLVVSMSATVVVFVVEQIMNLMNF